MPANSSTLPHRLSSSIWPPSHSGTSARRSNATVLFKLGPNFSLTTELEAVESFDKAFFVGPRRYFCPAEGLWGICSQPLGYRISRWLANYLGNVSIFPFSHQQIPSCRQTSGVYTLLEKISTKDPSLFGIFPDIAVLAKASRRPGETTMLK
ncbi:hypothetical protein BDN72DRAFT_503802 [Pluteus cervinus]|uniref:Uncharacterized protein n=1 Tax=Pluteus cervinus TaxID=181527 RepID=A0ACD3AYJ2_9AGAR|nr:hypothetical protein BDN72DRAFT_503802 [Pluteus cervinus]